MEKGSKQGFSASKFREAIKVASGTKNLVPVEIFDAIVKNGSQNSETMTCYVDSVDSSCSNLEVRYNICISDGIVAVPADGSTVTIAKTAFTDPYIVKASDLNSLFIGIGSQSYSNDGTIQSFQSYGNEQNDFGGIIKLIDSSDSNAGVLFRIQQIENTLNQLLGYWNAFCTVYVPGSPTTTGLPATLSTDTVNQISPTTTRQDLENPNIIHGLTQLP